MAEIIKTISTRQDVYVLGQFPYYMNGLFGITDDYSGCSVISGDVSEDVLCPGWITVLSEDELRGHLSLALGNKDRTLDDWLGAYDINDEPHNALIVYDFVGDIKLQLTSTVNGKELPFKFREGNYIWDMIPRTPDRFHNRSWEPAIDFGPNAHISEPISAAAAFRSIVEPIPHHRERSKLPRLAHINCPVLSYCGIPEEITDKVGWLKETTCDSYVEYTLHNGESVLDEWLWKSYPDLHGSQFLIHIDY